jgi:hypothetical protein
MFQVIQDTIPIDSFYYNAPKHLVITSPYFSQAPVNSMVDNTLSDDEYEARAEARQKKLQEAREKRIAMEEEARAARAEAKRIRDELARIERAKKSAENKKLAKPRVRKPEVWLDTRPARKAAQIKTLPAITEPVPEGFIPILQAADFGMRVPGIIIAIKSGRILAIKIQRRWYVNEVSACDYIFSSGQRRRDNAKLSLAKARAVRFGKDKTELLDCYSMESI